MKKFRRWLFKLLFGHDLLDYEEILKFAASVNKNSEEVLKLTTEIHNDNKEILELNGRVIDANKRALDTTNEAIEHCRNILILCQEVNVNETLG